MKVGDLVKLAMHKTRKGMPYDNMIGIVTEIGRPVNGFTFVKVTFDIEYTFNINDLRVISEAG